MPPSGEPPLDRRRIAVMVAAIVLVVGYWTIAIILGTPWWWQW